MLFLVVRLVTRHAVVRRRGREQRLRPSGHVAAGARQLPMVPQELEPGHLQMIEVRPFPALLIMAAHTSGWITTPSMLFLVVGLMTGDTVLGSGWIEPEVPARQMAGAARDAAMGSMEGESGREYLVVELTDIRPCHGRVTGEAVGGEAQGHMVHGLGSLVLLPMTREALRRRRVECPTLVGAVAALATGLEVGPLQGEGGALVDKKAVYVLEGNGGMAGTAVR